MPSEPTYRQAVVNQRAPMTGYPAPDGSALPMQWGREEFEQFLGAVDDLQVYDIRPDGAYIVPAKLGRVDLLTTTELDELTWTPRCEVEGGRPMGEPALPFPFDARQLAAFMLDGSGWFLHELAVDAEAVQEQFSAHGEKGTRDALSSAIEAMDSAESVVGTEPEAPADRSIWRRSMVQELMRPLTVSKAGAPAPESARQRQARRYQMCIDAGLAVSDNPAKALPRGIGILAKKEGVARQSFAEDIKAYVRTRQPS